LSRFHFSLEELFLAISYPCVMVYYCSETNEQLSEFAKNSQSTRQNTNQ